MAKAIISNKIYLDTTPELIQKLIRTLTYKIRYFQKVLCLYQLVDWT